MKMFLPLPWSMVFLYDKQSDKVAQLVRNLWTTYLLEWQSMVPFGDVIKGVAENLLL